jgi:hypothetical protein
MSHLYLNLSFKNNGSHTGHKKPQTKGFHKSAEFPPNTAKNPTIKKVNKAPIIYEPVNNPIKNINFSPERQFFSL